MEKKRKRTKTGTVALVIGTALLAGGAYKFTIRGSEAIAAWLTVMAMVPLVMGIVLLVQASKSR
jgi:hypothetical protein